MKKTYKRPVITMVNVETSSFIAASPKLQWVVKKDVEDETEDPFDFGDINKDNGEGSYPKDIDPWNPDNW